MSKTPLVIYHASCFDGFTSAWLFYRHKNLFHSDGIEYHAATYGEDPPDVKGREVYVVDFSYPREVMKAMIIESKKTTVLDHHKTAEAALSGLLMEIRMKVNRTQDVIVFDMNRSGAGITYDYLEEISAKKRGFRVPRHNDQRGILLVDYIEDRDLWRMSLPGSHAVSAWVSAQPQTFESWDSLAEDVKPDIGGDSPAMHRGGAIMLYMAQYGEKACEHAHVEKVGGHEVPVMNLP